MATNISDAYPQLLSWLQGIAFSHDADSTTTAGVSRFCHAEYFLVGEVVSPIHNSPIYVSVTHLVGLSDYLHDYSSSVSDITLNEIPDNHGILLSLVLCGI